MSQQRISLQNLTEGSQESLGGLIQALVSDTATASDEKLKGDVFARLTQKLTEVMGPETPDAMKQRRNERGELINEEGLPIIDITEPVDLHTHNIHSPATVEPLIPLASLPIPVRERLRERRNKILDLLEEEERQTELLEKERELQERAESLRKRKEEATREKNGSREARELQKKMGRALLHSMGQARKREEEERETLRLQDEEMDRRRSPSNNKKTVTFAERPQSHENGADNEPSADSEWGDITPARLRSIKRSNLASQSLLDRHPMKMSVVERIPGGQTTLFNTCQSPTNLSDSDDESDPEHMSNLSDNTSDEEEPILEEDEVDFDLAQHQREIAMEYYKKRNVIGQEAASALSSHAHEIDEEGVESSRKGKKPVVSQFRANKLAAAYGAGITNSNSASLGASVLSATSTRTIQRAIKMGKLGPEGQLVGAEDNSASDDEEPGVQEVLELLQKGEIYNLGQNGEYLHVNPSPSPSTSQSDHHQQPALTPPSRRSGPSKFKASRAAFGRTAESRVMGPSSQINEAPSPSMTPVSHQNRSSPKLDEASAEELTTVNSPDPMKPQALYSSPLSMVSGSPSSPKPKGQSKTAPSPSILPSSRRLERPPAVLSTKVYESKRTTPFASVPSTNNNSLETTSNKKVSKFKAERM